MGGGGGFSPTSLLTGGIAGALFTSGVSSLMSNQVSMPPSTEWVSLNEYQANNNLALIRQQAELEMLQMQLTFTKQLEAIQNQYTLPDAPEISEVEDIEWTDKIAEMEVDARIDIADLTYTGSASGTLITTPLLWDEEPNVMSKSLLAG